MKICWQKYSDFRMENEYLKKLNALVQKAEKSEKKTKVAVISELRRNTN